MRQIPLKLVVNKENCFDNFWGGPNSSLVDELQSQIKSNSSAQWIYLQGQQGAGKSHLLQACYQYSQKNGLKANYLAFPELVSFWVESMETSSLDSGEWVEAFTDADWLFVDELDFKVTVNEKQRKLIDRALFQLLNYCLLEQKPRLMFASREAIAKLMFQLEDLRSRLGLAHVLNLKPLNDEDMSLWLRFKADQLGFKMEQEAASFLLRRWPRDLHALNHALTQLNDFSLSHHRRVTIPAIKQALAI